MDDRKSHFGRGRRDAPGAFAVDAREQASRFALGLIDSGIGGRVEHNAPRARRTAASMGQDRRQVALRPTNGITVT